MQTTEARETVEYTFGPFRLSSTARLLEINGAPVKLSSRAFDILTILVEQAGTIVGQSELMRRAWPGITVEEATLRVHIANLRRALGDRRDASRFIANVPGRGYSFVGSITRFISDAPPPHMSRAQSQDIETVSNFLPPPPALGRMVGRAGDVETARRLVLAERFVTIVGTGGVGKTTLAIGVAAALEREFQQAIAFVDLASLDDGGFVPVAVAAALGSVGPRQDWVGEIIGRLSQLRTLLILDNCEHLISNVAILAERIHARSPAAHILATSREALRVEGENIYRLHPLATPEEEMAERAAAALATPAVELFMDRAAAGGYRSELTDDQAPIVSRICRDLDGLPLALELAGSRVATYGIDGTAMLLADPMALLQNGRRDARPSHHTLNAMVDWSYNLLNDRDRVVLPRLTIFTGRFTREAAIAVAAANELKPSDVGEALVSLVDRSLLSVQSDSEGQFYKLLETTRARFRRVLATDAQIRDVRRRHASYYSTQLPVAPAAGAGELTEPGRSSALVANTREALSWAFSSDGDPHLAFDLAVRAVPALLAMSLLEECCRWCERALAILPSEDAGTRRELVLQEALSISAMFTRSNSDDVRVAIKRGLEIANSLNEHHRQLNLLAGLHIFLTRVGDTSNALAVAEQSRDLASNLGTSEPTIIAEWMLGVSHHLRGDQNKALFHCETGLREASAKGRRHVDYFGYDHLGRALVALARSAWLRGFPDQGAQYARDAIAHAESRDHSTSLAIALLYASTVFIWRGDWDEASRLATRLLIHSHEYDLRPYHAAASALKAKIMIGAGETAAGVFELRGALHRMDRENYNTLRSSLCGALAGGLCQLGRTSEAMLLIDSALDAARRNGDLIDLPELIRIKTEIMLKVADASYLENADLLNEAINITRKLSATGLELRCTMTLVDVWRQSGNSHQSLSRIIDVRSRFSEGTGTRDIVLADNLIAALRASA